MIIDSFRPQNQCIVRLYGLKDMFYNDESQWIFTKLANMKFYMFDMLQRFDYRKCYLGQCKWEPATTHMHWKDVFRP